MLTALGVALWASACAAGMAGQSGPATLPSLALRPDPAHGADLQAFRDTPMVLNVWATWCPPCRREMPSLQALSDKLAAHGIRVVALSVDEDVNLMKEFLIKYRIDLPAPVAESASEVYRKLDAVALPVTYFVRRGGEIVGRHVGAREWDRAEIVEEIRAMLGPRVASAARESAD